MSTNPHRGAIREEARSFSELEICGAKRARSSENLRPEGKYERERLSRFVNAQPALSEYNVWVPFHLPLTIISSDYFISIIGNTVE